MRFYPNLPIEIEELITEETRARIAAQKRADEAEGEWFKWQARAEAAEEKLGQYVMTIPNDVHLLKMRELSWLADRDELQRRVAELEARLAELKHGQDEYEQFLWGDNVVGSGNNDNAGTLKDVKRRVNEYERDMAVQGWTTAPTEEVDRDMLVEVRFITTINEYTGVPDIYDMNSDYPPKGLHWRLLELPF